MIRPYGTAATPDLAWQTVSTVYNSSEKKKKKRRMRMRMSGSTKHLGVRGHSMGPARASEGLRKEHNALLKLMAMAGRAAGRAGESEGH